MRWVHTICKWYNLFTKYMDAITQWVYGMLRLMMKYKQTEVAKEKVSWNPPFSSKTRMKPHNIDLSQSQTFVQWCHFSEMTTVMVLLLIIWIVSLWMSNNSEVACTRTYWIFTCRNFRANDALFYWKRCKVSCKFLVKLAFRHWWQFYNFTVDAWNRSTSAI